MLHIIVPGDRTGADNRLGRIIVQRSPGNCPFHIFRVRDIVGPTAIIRCYARGSVVFQKPG